MKFVTVVNNFEIFDKVFRQNSLIEKYEQYVFDNTVENVGISERYNSFINQNIDQNSDFWIIFCHQDFGFFEDPFNNINSLDKNYIYGAVGVGFKYKQKKIIRFLDKKFYTTKKGIHLFGEIHQGNNDFEFFKHGERLSSPYPVETVDCCCIIVHSSLISRYNLRFDENLKFHMYSEDFSITARKKHNIETKVVQLECYHLGKGTIDEIFYDSLEYVKNKHGINRLICTTIPHHKEIGTKRVKKFLFKVFSIKCMNKLFRPIASILEE